MYVLMFTCMCVAAEYRKERVADHERRLRPNCTFSMHYSKRRESEQRERFQRTPTLFLSEEEVTR